MSPTVEFLDEPRREKCPDCGGVRIAHAGKVRDATGTVAVFTAWEYDHDEPEVFVEVTFGDSRWGRFRPRHTFGSRFGRVEGQDDPACTLVTGGATAPPDAAVGHRLTRAEALEHPRLDEFWTINDLVLEQVSLRHGASCSCCGHDLDEYDRHVRFRLPDIIDALPRREQTPGVGLSDPDPMRADFLESAEHGCFVRSLVRIPLTDGYSLTCGAWVRVTPETAQRIGRAWSSDLYVALRFEGWLANALPQLGHLESRVSSAVVIMDSLPHVVGSSDPGLARDLESEHDAAMVLAAARMPAPTR